MKHQRLFGWLFVALLLAILLSPIVYWLTGIGQSAQELTAEIGRQPDGTLASSPKAEALHRLTLPMRIEVMIVLPLLLLSFQFSGGAVALRCWLEQRVPAPKLNLQFPGNRSETQQQNSGQTLSPPIDNPTLGHSGSDQPQIRSWQQRISWYDLLIIVLFMLLFEIGLALLYLPSTFYRGFILAHQFGLSTQTFPAWVNDWFKNLLIGLVTGGVLWTGFFLLMRLLPRRWPIPGGIALLAVGFVFTLLAPLLVTPLFYEVRPLDDAGLTARIVALTERAGMLVDEVYVIDASAKTTRANAYFTGFGDARRIVLYDTLVSGYAPDQIEVVLAHEMGHWYYRHVFWSILVTGIVGWVGLFGLRWLLNRTWRPLGLRGPADVAGLPYIMAIVAIATILSLPVQNGISRLAERQADQFALVTSQQPAAFIELFEQFAEQNLSLIDTSAWEKYFFYTHPPIADRIQMAETWSEEE